MAKEHVFVLTMKGRKNKRRKQEKELQLTKITSHRRPLKFDAVDTTFYEKHEIGEINKLFQGC